MRALTVLFATILERRIDHHAPASDHRRRAVGLESLADYLRQFAD